MVDIKSRLQRIYSGAKINVDGKIYLGESEMNGLMMESRNFSTLLYAWIGWHNTIGPESKDLFEEMIKIENEGAKAAGLFFRQFLPLALSQILKPTNYYTSLGYHDISQFWKNELEIDNIEKLVNELYEEIKPLYIQVG